MASSCGVFLLVRTRSIASHVSGIFKALQFMAFYCIATALLLLLLPIGNAYRNVRLHTFNNLLVPATCLVRYKRYTGTC